MLDILAGCRLLRLQLRMPCIVQCVSLSVEGAGTGKSRSQASIVVEGFWSKRNEPYLVVLAAPRFVETERGRECGVLSERLQAINSATGRNSIEHTAMKLARRHA